MAGGRGGRTPRHAYSTSEGGPPSSRRRSYYLHGDTQSLALGLISGTDIFRKLSVDHTSRKSALPLMEGGRRQGGQCHRTQIPRMSPSLHDSLWRTRNCLLRPGPSLAQTAASRLLHKDPEQGSADLNQPEVPNGQRAFVSRRFELIGAIDSNNTYLLLLFMWN